MRNARSRRGRHAVSLLYWTAVSSVPSVLTHRLPAVGRCPRKRGRGRAGALTRRRQRCHVRLGLPWRPGRSARDRDPRSRHGAREIPLRELKSKSIKMTQTNLNSPRGMASASPLRLLQQLQDRSESQQEEALRNMVQV